MIGKQLNIAEARHRLARRIFFGQSGELRQHYRKGMEDQPFVRPAQAGRRPLRQPSADEDASEA
ncbi:Tn3 family transposase [Streptomyces xiangluensis]|uniref:Tn3 family transposase n=1 Tax=Streptomyces xiangluensis TaxID=2665720 RepID=A0ABV8YI48_9ACTN|nr:Tn3 family transposase [Streptomyces yerevanensis]